MENIVNVIRNNFLFHIFNGAKLYDKILDKYVTYDSIESYKGNDYIRCYFIDDDGDNILIIYDKYGRTLYYSEDTRLQPSKNITDWDILSLKKGDVVYYYDIPFIFVSFGNTFDDINVFNPLSSRITKKTIKTEYIQFGKSFSNIMDAVRYINPNYNTKKYKKDDIVIAEFPNDTAILRVKGIKGNICYNSIYYSTKLNRVYYGGTTLICNIKRKATLAENIELLKAVKMDIYSTFVGNYKYCIPYNKETKHLFNTTKNYD